MNEKDAAHAAVSRAVRAGSLPRINRVRCRICGLGAAVYHHWSYAERHQLDVVPLCDRCHAEVHAGKTADPTTGVRAASKDDPDDRGSCPWPPPPEPTPETVAARLRRLQVFRAVAVELGPVAARNLFAEAERRLTAERT